MSKKYSCPSCGCECYLEFGKCRADKVLDKVKEFLSEPRDYPNFMNIEMAMDSLRELIKEWEEGL